ncbi:hypothetical protein IV494_08135 [Kaistella sp. G5-32]|uniref:Uncharacterized protein n=1 Tax=Kaistella gelatinilytica TaxID=2787636 RepID=A0ABS0FBQ0_9FLAO|nr:hypothetical protein [Kaistella gelatinilytica]MBF8457151.1 hypothetical protein [Kaistella gelatinilytica]
MYKLLLIFLLINTLAFAQNKGIMNYTLYSKIDNEKLSPILKSNSKVIFDFDMRKITVIRNNKKQFYKISSAIQQGISSSGEDYSEVMTIKGKDEFLVRLLSNRVMIIRVISRTGLVLYN